MWRVLAVPVVAAIALGAAGGAASAAPSKGEAESLKARAQGLVEAGYPAALAAVSDSKGESAGWPWVRAVWRRVRLRRWTVR